MRYNLVQLFMTLTRRGQADLAANTAGRMAVTGVETFHQWLDGLILTWATEPKARSGQPAYPDLAAWLDEQIEPILTHSGAPRD